MFKGQRLHTDMSYDLDKIMAASSDPSPITKDAEAPTSNASDVAVPASQTATDYINTQLRLEADAREVLPFSFEHCTQTLGPLRQRLFSCLTCNPPPASSNDPHTPAAVCYSCSIACHGEHTLVELFHRRNFVCDCGTTRLPPTSSCNLRIDPKTGMKGPVHSEDAAPANTYNHNFRNRFCGCGEWYDAEKEKGTMFQCLGLKAEADGGCGEDWWHPECVIWGEEEGKRRRKEAEAQRRSKKGKQAEKVNAHANGESKSAETIGVNEDTNGVVLEGPHSEDAEDHEENELPPGFPDEDDFDNFICHKCVDAVPVLKQYAGTEGFLPAVLKREPSTEDPTTTAAQPFRPVSELNVEVAGTNVEDTQPATSTTARKRSADEANLDVDMLEADSKKTKPDDSAEATTTDSSLQNAYHTTLPAAPTGQFSLFCKSDFRDSICRCRTCYPLLAPYPMLLEEEDTYEPPLSDSGDSETAGSVGSKSILDMGEEALSNVDRVRAIEGVMVYNHLKDKVKTFLKPFAESGTPVGAEDIKKYFEGLRGDQLGASGQSGGAQREEGGESEGGDRKEQSGY